jgi:S-DNA-T family DNA segregation ATPase FtsK/SpoIIIE
MGPIIDPSMAKASSKRARSAKRSRTTKPKQVQTLARRLKLGRVGYEVRGIGLAGLGVVLGLSLLSAFSQSGNWIGPLGEVAARAALWSFGLTAYLLPALLVAVSLPWLRGIARPAADRARWAWAGLLGVAACGLLSASLGAVPLSDAPVDAGGMLGALLSGTLSGWIGPLGSRLLLGTVALVALAMVSERSLLVVLRSLLHALEPAGQALLRAVRRLGGLFRAGCFGFLRWLVEAWQNLFAGLRELRDTPEQRYDAEPAAAAQEPEAAPPEPVEEPTELSSEAAAVEVDSLAMPPGPAIEPLQPAPEPVQAAASVAVEPRIHFGEPADASEHGGSDPATSGAASSVAAGSSEGADEAFLSDPEIAPPIITDEEALPEPPAVSTGASEALDAASVAVPIGEPSADGDGPVVCDRVVEDDEEDPLLATPPDAVFELPSPELLQLPEVTERKEEEREALIQRSSQLERALDSYGVKGRVVGIHPGPVVTRFDFEPGRGVKVSRVMGLADDLSLALASAGAVRVGGVIPGRSAIGIEVPNSTRETVYLREVVRSKAFKGSSYKLPTALGRDIEGRSIAADLARMPHVLVAGATGMGKSVTVNSILVSMLLSRTPEELRLILIDPKMLEFRIYDGIPHLLVPVVTDPRKAAAALRWAVNEMNRRYRILSRMGVRSIAGYNARIDEYLASRIDDPDLIPTLDQDAEPALRAAAAWSEAFDQGRILDDDGTDLGAAERMPYVVIVIDELADLMMVAKKEVEESVVRLAQMARAAGLHMILATQRPSVDVITGLIKANMPSRISCRVTSKTDSRTILDANGAEHLLGKGDMLFLSPGHHGLKRVHGCFVSDDEVGRIADHLREQGQPRYEDDVLSGAMANDDGTDGDDDDESPKDELYLRALEIVVRTQRASASGLQTRLGIGYPRAARLVDQLYKDGIVGEANGSKPRKVLLKPFELEERYPGLLVQD